MFDIETQAMISAIGCFIIVWGCLIIACATVDPTFKFKQRDNDVDETEKDYHLSKRGRGRGRD